jgi:hypothetical protein
MAYTAGIRGFDRMDPDREQLGMLRSGFERSARQAGDQARGAAMTLGQGGSPFAAMRAGSAAAGDAAARVLGQGLQAERQLLIQQAERRRIEEQERKTRAERMLMGGLAAGAAGVGTLLQGFGGGGAPGTTSGIPGAMMTGSTTAGPTALAGIMERNPDPGAAPAPTIAPIAAPGSPMPTAAQQPQQQAAPAAPGGFPLTIGRGGPMERREGTDLGAMFQSGGSALGTMFPGYGSLAGFGLGALGSLMSGGRR